MEKDPMDELLRITEEELQKAPVREELNSFLDDVLPEEDFIGMEDLKIENEPLLNGMVK